jgi:ribose/xylose/arabinose/galactoside ABC-type transport system permease subunit
MGVLVIAVLAYGLLGYGVDEYVIGAVIGCWLVGVILSKRRRSWQGS